MNGPGSPGVLSCQRPRPWRIGMTSLDHNGWLRARRVGRRSLARSHAPLTWNTCARFASLWGRNGGQSAFCQPQSRDKALPSSSPAATRCRGCRRHVWYWLRAGRLAAACLPRGSSPRRRKLFPAPFPASRRRLRLPTEERQKRERQSASAAAASAPDTLRNE
jgi:hypothetical protein